MMPRTSTFLDAAQLRFFETFGFLRLPGLFADEIDDITTAFEARFAATPPSDPHHELDTEGFGEAFASRSRIDSYHHLNFGEHRAIIPEFVETTEGLRWLLSDERIVGIVTSVLGPDHEYRSSDGNLLWCDTSWHCDLYDAPLDRYHVKLFFYLDPIDADSGALRVIPGTHHWTSEFATTLRRDLDDWTKVPELFGVAVDEIPSWTVESRPGDLLVGNFRTIHATFNSAPRRRLFTLNYRRAE